MSVNPNKHKMIACGMMLYFCSILSSLLFKPINKTTFTPYFIGFIGLLQWLCLYTHKENSSQHKKTKTPPNQLTLLLDRIDSFSFCPLYLNMHLYHFFIHITNKVRTITVRTMGNDSTTNHQEIRKNANTVQNHAPILSQSINPFPFI